MRAPVSLVSHSPNGKMISTLGHHARLPQVGGASGNRQRPRLLCPAIATHIIPHSASSPFSCQPIWPRWVAWLPFPLHTGGPNTARQAGSPRAKLNSGERGGLGALVSCFKLSCHPISLPTSPLPTLLGFLHHHTACISVTRSLLHPRFSLLHPY